MSSSPVMNSLHQSVIESIAQAEDYLSLIPTSNKPTSPQKKSPLPPNNNTANANEINKANSTQNTDYNQTSPSPSTSNKERREMITRLAVERKIERMKEIDNNNDDAGEVVYVNQFETNNKDDDGETNDNDDDNYERSQSKVYSVDSMVSSSSSPSSSVEDEDGGEGEVNEVYYASDIHNNVASNVAWNSPFDGDSNGDEDGDGDEDLFDINVLNNDLNEQDNKKLKPKPTLSSEKSRRTTNPTNPTRSSNYKQSRHTSPSSSSSRPPPPSTYYKSKTKDKNRDGDKELTFAPRTNHPPPPPSTSSSNTNTNSNPNTNTVPVHIRLNAHATSILAKRHSQSLLKTALDNTTTAQTCTFQPTLTSRGKNSRASNIAESVDRLYSDAREREGVRECTKYHLEEAELASHSFKPTTNVSVNANSALIDGLLPLHLRVSEIERKKVEKLEKIKNDVREQEKVWFKPNINKSSSTAASPAAVNKSASGSLFVDANEVDDDDDDDEVEGEASFSDIERIISSNSKYDPPLLQSTLHPELSSNLTAGQRLHTTSARQTDRSLSRSLAYSSQLSSSMPFKPTICSSTHAILSNSDKSEEYSRTFVERQRVYEDELLRRRGEASRCEEERYVGLFKPSIGARNGMNNGEEGRAKKETEDERVLRMSVTENNAVEDRRRKKRAEEDSKFNYNPTINNVSKALAHKSTSVKELNDNPRGKAVKQRAMREAEEVYKNAHTFKPKIKVIKSKASGNGNSNSGNLNEFTFGNINIESQNTNIIPSNSQTQTQTQSQFKPPTNTNERFNLKSFADLTLQVSRYNARKEYERLEKVRAREVEELKECTFAPKTNASSSSCGNRSGSYGDAHARSKKNGGANGGVVIVRGLGRYLELKGLAKKQTLDQKAREDKAFHVRVNTSSAGGCGSSNMENGMLYPDGTTVVKAFNLTQSRAVEVRDKVRLGVEKRYSQECTFVPDTVERRNRGVLEGILGDD